MPQTDCLSRVAEHLTGTGFDPPHDLERFVAHLCKFGCILGEPNVRGPHDALVLVPTKSRRWCHALFWCNRSGKLLDCRAEGTTEIALSSTLIKCWVPIQKAT